MQHCVWYMDDTWALPRGFIQPSSPWCEGVVWQVQVPCPHAGLDTQSYTWIPILTGPHLDMWSVILIQSALTSSNLENARKNV